MKHLAYILTLIVLSGCVSKTVQHSEENENANNISNNEIVKQYKLDSIPFISNLRFELDKKSNLNLAKKHMKLTQQQIDFFFSKEEQSQLSEMSEINAYFLGKRNLRNNQLAVFILCDFDYLGINLYCATLDKNGKLKNKFTPAYLELDAGYSISGKGEFLNDTTYQLIETCYEYIDYEHKLKKKDYSVKIIAIGLDSTRIQSERKYPTDTIVER